MYLIRQLKDWLKTSQAAKTSFYFLGLLSLLILSTQSNQVLAQETEGTFPFPTPEGDLSIKLIGKIFGGLVEIAGGTNGGDPFGGAIGAFNAAVLALGGILAAYTIFAGTVGTAHDGEMMGKKFSSAWVPIRTALGSALVLPVFGGGYCAMQAIVMWLVFQGVGLADMTWSAYVKSSAEGGGIYESVPVAPDTQALAANILRASTCYLAMAKAAAQVGDTKIIPKNWGVSKDEGSRMIEFGNLDGGEDYVITKNACGSVSYGSKSRDLMVTNELVSQAGSGIIQGAINGFKTVTSMQPIYDAQSTATANLIAAIKPLAQNIVDNKDVKASEMDAAILAYQKTIIVAALAVQKSVGASPFDNIKKDAESQGWFLAGAWYMKIVNASNKMGTAVEMIPSSFGASSRVDTKASYMQDASAAIYRAEQITAKIKKNQQGGLAPQESGSWTDWITNPTDKIISSITNLIIRGAAGVDLKTLNENKKHPIIIMNKMGNNLIASSTIMFTAVAGVGFLMAPTLSGGTNVILVLLPLVTIVAGAMIGSGFMLSYYIPMVPLLIWTGAVLGWVILVVEAIIAAPLWAVMHLHPHGDDLTGKGGGGYMLILGLLIRPVLMIFGLIASLTIVQVFGEMLNTIYYDSLNIAYGGESQFLGLIFGVVIYVALMTTFIQKSFSIIHVIPDQLLKWIGGGSEQLGQYAGEFNKSGQGAAAGAGGLMGSKIGGELSSAGGRYQSNKLLAENNKINKEAKDQSASRAKADMESEVTGKWGALERAENAVDWKSMGEDARAEAKDAEAERFNRLGRIGGNEAEMDYAKRTKEATENGKTQGEATSEAYGKTREESLEKAFGKEGAAWINKNSNNGANIDDERKAISSARSLVGIGKNQNNAQETFKQANEKENLSDSRNHIQDVIKSGTLDKTAETLPTLTPGFDEELKGSPGEEAKTEENKSNDTESDSTPFPKIDPSFLSPGANPSLFNSGSTEDKKPSNEK